MPDAMSQFVPSGATSVSRRAIFESLARGEAAMKSLAVDGGDGIDSVVINDLDVLVLVDRVH